MIIGTLIEAREHHITIEISLKTAKGPYFHYRNSQKSRTKISDLPTTLFNAGIRKTTRRGARFTSIKNVVLETMSDHLPKI
ncbi:hypothetical protein [Alkalihalobacterium sp. APHAB7]|uniref:hypothetical protein n=1 Tax=Alkalihalobacterium sp. APHAB7 TaxID=3402081 RepID=UPI003AAB2E8F